MASEPRISYTFVPKRDWLSGDQTETRKGVFIKKIRHTSRYWQKCGAKQLAMVRFDGNKSISTVPYEDLVFDREPADV